MVIMRSVKDLLSIKIKTRHDSYCDQFSRLFMTKMLIIASVVMSFDYFSDRVSCMTPGKSGLSKEFIHSACWISGFYIYEEMRFRLDKSGHYGIPQKIEYDGFNYMTYELCQVKDDIFGENEYCRPMTKLYYLQYQWMPFYIGSLAVLYYLPYIMFRIVNTDLVSLKSVMKSLNGDADNIVKNYFNYKVNPVSRLRLRIWLNMCVKALYIFANIFAFYFTDYLLLGNYLGYGTSYLNWSNLNTTEAHVKINLRNAAKPGLFSPCNLTL